MLNVTRAASESKAQASQKNRWQAIPLPAGDVGPRTAGRASAQTNCPGLQRTEPRVHLGMSRTDRTPKTGGEGIEGARTYIPTPGCMRERFIIGAPTSALFLQPRKKTQATSRGKKIWGSFHRNPLISPPAHKLAYPPPPGLLPDTPTTITHT